jgi:hypothetical protein
VGQEAQGLSLLQRLLDDFRQSCGKGRFCCRHGLVHALCDSHKALAGQADHVDVAVLLGIPSR